MTTAGRSSPGGSYDLQGTFVEFGEPGLESSLLNPIEVLSGGLRGLRRGAFARRSPLARTRSVAGDRPQRERWAGCGMTSAPSPRSACVQLAGSVVSIVRFDTAVP
jgi:hypothetical protein